MAEKPNLPITVELTDLKYKYQIELKYVKEYINFNEIELTKRQLKIKQMFLEDLIDFPRKDIIEELYKEDLNKIPAYFYHSTLILVFTIFESVLSDICNEITQKLNLPIELDELFGNNYISKGKTFLEKFAEIDFLNVDGTWVEITKYQKIRNLIIHQNSQIKLNSDSLVETKEFKLISGIKNIEIDSLGNFYIKNSKPIFNFIKLTDLFLRYIITQIESKPYYAFKAASPLLDEDDDELPF